MGAVHFNLNQGALLGGMAPPALAGGAFGNAALPVGLVGAGAYLIVNNNTNNRYVGISTNLANRFATRLATITEMGFSTAQMNQIGVYWGTVSTQNTAGAFGPPPPWVPLVGYGAPMNTNIDGQPVQLERLFIRFLLTQFVGGTISNNMLAFTPYVNPTGNPVTVNFTWGPGGPFNAGAHAAVWPVGGLGW